MTKETLTAHGEVSYETVTCASCGTEHPKEACERFVIGSLYKPERDIYGIFDKYGYNEIHFRNGFRMGWACPNCKDTDPIAFPQTDSFWKRLKWLLTGET